MFRNRVAGDREEGAAVEGENAAFDEGVGEGACGDDCPFPVGGLGGSEPEAGEGIGVFDEQSQSLAAGGGVVSPASTEGGVGVLTVVVGETSAGGEVGVLTAAAGTVISAVAAPGAGVGDPYAVTPGSHAAEPHIDTATRPLPGSTRRTYQDKTESSVPVTDRILDGVFRSANPLVYCPATHTPRGSAAAERSREATPPGSPGFSRPAASVARRRRDR